MPMPMRALSNTIRKGSSLEGNAPSASSVVPWPTPSPFGLAPAITASSGSARQFRLACCMAKDSGQKRERPFVGVFLQACNFGRHAGNALLKLAAL